MIQLSRLFSAFDIQRDRSSQIPEQMILISWFFSVNQNIYKSIGEVLSVGCPGSAGGRVGFGLGVKLPILLAYSRLMRLKSMRLGCLYDKMHLKIHILNLVVTCGMVFKLMFLIFCFLIGYVA